MKYSDLLNSLKSCQAELQTAHQEHIDYKQRATSILQVITLPIVYVWPVLSVTVNVYCATVQRVGLDGLDFCCTGLSSVLMVKLYCCQLIL